MNFNVRLNEKSEKDLERLLKATGMNKTELLEKCLSNLNFLIIHEETLTRELETANVPTEAFDSFEKGFIKGQLSEIQQAKRYFNIA